MQFIRATHVSQAGLSRCMHDYVYGTGVPCGAGEVPWKICSSFHGRVSGLPHPHGAQGAWRAWTLVHTHSPAQKGAPVSVEWWVGHWGAGPISTGVGTMGYMLGCSQPRW